MGLFLDHIAACARDGCLVCRVTLLIGRESDPIPYCVHIHLHATRFGLYRSNLFTEPLIGFFEFTIPAEEGSTLAWHSLFKEGADIESCKRIEGEVLLTVRRYAPLLWAAWSGDRWGVG